MHREDSTLSTITISEKTFPGIRIYGITRLLWLWWVTVILNRVKTMFLSNKCFMRISQNSNGMTTVHFKNNLYPKMVFSIDKYKTQRTRKSVTTWMHAYIFLNCILNVDILCFENSAALRLCVYENKTWHFYAVWNCTVPSLMWLEAMQMEQ